LGLWRRVGAERKLKFAVLLIIAGLTAHVCVTVGRYVEELLANKAAASSALYMDSFVEPLVQDLATDTSFSPEGRRALEAALAPTTIGKPVISFRIWLGDRIAFSNRGDLIGRQFPATTARNNAFAGNVVARFGLDGDDDADERALGVPVLEVYAPIRQTGTNRIIALAETTEIATTLLEEIRAAQYATYAVILSTASALVLLLSSLPALCKHASASLPSRKPNTRNFASECFRLMAARLS